MSKVQANKSDSKGIKELRSKFPNANIPTEIEENDKGYYNILCCFISITRGTNVEFNHRVVTTTEKDYNNQVSKGIFNNASYLCDEIHILHDPMQYEKEQAELAAKEAADKKVKKEDKA
jgi:hypothetical protein